MSEGAANSEMLRTLDRFADFGSQFIFPHLMKSCCQFRCLLCIHGKRLKVVIAEFYSPDASVISMRFNQQYWLIRQTVIHQQGRQCNHHGIESNSACTKNLDAGVMIGAFALRSKCTSAQPSVRRCGPISYRYLGTDAGTLVANTNFHRHSFN